MQGLSKSTHMFIGVKLFSVVLLGMQWNWPTSRVPKLSNSFHKWGQWIPWLNFMSLDKCPTLLFIFCACLDGRVPCLYKDQWAPIFKHHLRENGVGFVVHDQVHDATWIMQLAPSFFWGITLTGIELKHRLQWWHTCSYQLNPRLALGCYKIQNINSLETASIVNGSRGVFESHLKALGT